MKIQIIAGDKILEYVNADLFSPAEKGGGTIHRKGYASVVIYGNPVIIVDESR